MESYGKEIILTATAAIFSPDMKRIIMVVNRRLGRILPPGGKFDPKKDADILCALLREIGEEIGLALFPGTGIFLDIDGRSTDNINPVFIENFDFIDGSGLGRDSLFFFRLHDEIFPSDLNGETQGFFLTKEGLKQVSMEREGQAYELFFPEKQASQMKRLILEVMKD